MSIRPVPAPVKMNRSPAKAAGVGNETKAAVGAAQSKGTNAGIPTGGNAKGPGDTGLSGAVSELHSQHPHSYHDRGPHHGTSTHIRHKPVQVKQ